MVFMTFSFLRRHFATAAESSKTFVPISLNYLIFCVLFFALLRAQQYTESQSWIDYILYMELNYVIWPKVFIYKYTWMWMWRPWAEQYLNDPEGIFD